MLQVFLATHIVTIVVRNIVQDPHAGQVAFVIMAAALRGGGQKHTKHAIPMGRGVRVVPLALVLRVLY